MSLGRDPAGVTPSEFRLNDDSSNFKSHTISAKGGRVADDGLLRFDSASKENR